MLDGQRVLLIISGGIAAYKSLELIRRLKDRGVAVRCILTEGGAQFVTPLSAAALSGDKVYQELFSLTDEAEMGHIRLSREADLVVVAPATANLLAKMASGLADDLASTALLATDKPVLVAPAMNTLMWEHAATRANLATLEARGIHRIGPGAGDLACGEVGAGRMAEPAEILTRIEEMLGGGGPLAGIKAVVTSGPTHEAIDPVRYIANRSSGKQGHAIAAALARLGADVTLVSGPVALPDPAGLKVVRVESAMQMLNAVRAELPADLVVCAAAVADWTVTNRQAEKRKKKVGAPPPVIELALNPDILMTVSKADSHRPRLVVGFAAETEALITNAQDKRARKGCDWIVANDVSEGSGTFGGDSNTVHLITGTGVEDWPRMAKDEVAARLAARIAQAFEGAKP